MENKKKRGCNYTPAEKTLLLELIKKYQNILENKETNASIILKKRQTWEEVTQKYNALNSSGIRTWQQLRHLYENIKQRSKKNVAKENRNLYNENIKILKKKASDDKKEITRTGGGAYKSVLTETDAQVLAMVSSQIKPLQNPYDDAALYFGDTETCEEVQLVQDVQEQEVVVTCDVLESNINFDAVPSTSAVYAQQEPQRGNNDLSRSPVLDCQEPEHNEPFTSSVVAQDKSKKKSQTTKKKTMNETYKEQYLKTKLKSAKLEQRYLINRHKMEVNKYKLEMEILKLRLKKLQGPRQ